MISFKNTITSVFKIIGYEIHRIPHADLDIPDKDLYRPFFSPWLGKGDFSRYYNLAKSRTLVSIDRCYILYNLLLQALHVEGDIWECGVYRGGTAAMMAKVLEDKMPSKKLYLFDTFEGMPETNASRDLHEMGDFSDTTVGAVANYIKCREQCLIRKGLMPNTFLGLESNKIALAHIDVDIYKSIIDCSEFIWPRLSLGGFLIFDDYGFPSCPGARSAVDDFFSDKSSVPLCLSTGQALIFKGVA